MAWTPPPKRYRHATEDTPSGATPDDVEKTPVFDRADIWRRKSDGK